MFKGARAAPMVWAGGVGGGSCAGVRLEGRVEMDGHDRNAVPRMLPDHGRLQQSPGGGFQA